MDFQAFRIYLDGRLAAIDQKLDSIDDRVRQQNNRIGKGEDERKVIAVDLGKVQATQVAQGLFSIRDRDRLQRATETATSRLWSFVSDNWQGASTLGVIIYLLTK